MGHLHSVVESTLWLQGNVGEPDLYVNKICRPDQNCQVALALCS